jgi:hypothetical protein
MASRNAALNARAVYIVGTVGEDGVIDPGSIPVTPTSGALTDRSGTLTTGGTAQNAAAALATRKYLFVQNPSTAPGTLWFSTVTTAVQDSPSIELVPGASFESGLFCPTGAVSVIAATTGHKWTAREA